MRKRSPTKHPNGFYYSRIKGKRYNLGRSFKKAKKRLADLEKEVCPEEVGKVVPLVSIDGTKSIHIKELAVRHLQWVKDNRAERTFEIRQLCICHFLDFIGDRLVSEITFADLDAFYTHARKHHGRGPNRGNHSLREVKTMLIWGDEFEVCACPVKRFPKARSLPPATKRFSPEEIGKLLKASAPDFADLVRFAILTGLRPIELRTAQKSSLITEGSQSMLLIEHHKTAATSKSPLPRSVPLEGLALEIFHRQAKRRKKSPFVFLNAEGKPYDKDSLRKRLERACRKAGIPPRPPYAWRHFFGTMQAAGGTNIAIVSQLLGHSGFRTSYRYIANNDQAHRRAMGQMEQFVR